jgi:3-dehydroquinate dehydratase
MSLEIPSKICLSLKEIDFNLLETYRSITNLIEIRLDYIKFTQNEFNIIYNLFDYILLKSNDVEDYNNLLISRINEDNSKLIIDIDYKFIENNLLKDFGINPSSFKTLISCHNIDLDEISDIFFKLKSYVIILNPIIFKLVIMHELDVVSIERLNEYYKLFKKEYISKDNQLIMFVEGEEYLESRFYSLDQGAPYIYCSFDSFSKTGIGQPTYIEVQDYLRK